MKYKILKLNKDNTITLSKEELETMLEESYSEGFTAGCNSKQVISTPNTGGYDW